MFERILVPVDGSPPSSSALRTAIGLAAGNGAQLRLVHVLDQSAHWAGYDMMGGAAGQVVTAMQDSGKRLLGEALETAGTAGVSADSQLIDGLGAGPLGEVVADAAANWGADLVVVGTHGRRGPRRLLLGSGAEDIIRLSPVPVLVTRGPSDA